MYGDHRQRALDFAAEALSPMTECLHEAFERIDETIEYYRTFAADEPRGRVCALTTVKCRNLVVACHSLVLDGFAQESGALLRLLIEGIELLKYLREAPGAIDQAIENKLPNAGTRAKRIGSHLKDLRDHLNKNASHLAMSYDSMAHLMDFHAGDLRVVPPFNAETFQSNLASVLFLSGGVAEQAARTLHWCIEGTAPVSGESQVNKASRFMEKARGVSQQFYTLTEDPGVIRKLPLST